jgi:hypothetical protein
VSKCLHGQDCRRLKSETRKMALSLPIKDRGEAKFLWVKRRERLSGPFIFWVVIIDKEQGAGITRT